MTRIQKLAFAGAAIAALCRLISPAHAEKVLEICSVRTPNDTLNMRSLPNAHEGRILAALPDGSTVFVYDLIDHWAYVAGTINDPDDVHQGWVNTKYFVDCHKHLREGDSE
jgi:hypothetical protein